MLGSGRRTFGWAVAAVAVFGLAAGLATASDCDGWPCDDDVTTCFELMETTTDLCCLDLDGDEVRHCITCDRHLYLCDATPMLGPPYDCRNHEDVCQ